MRIDVETLIDAPMLTAFATAFDVGAWPNFIAGIEKIEVLTPGPLGVGSRFRETRRMFGRQAIEEMTIDEIVTPERFVLTAFSHGTAYRAVHQLAEVDGITRLLLMFEGEPKTLAARAMFPIGRLFLGSVKRQLADDLAAVKAEAERRHAEMLKR